jgi:ATP-binding cassette subfamily F protein 3
MLVSHDRALLRETCDEFWLVADGALKPFDGDLDDYQKWLVERSREAQRALNEANGKGAKKAAAANPPPAAAPVAAAAPTAQATTAPAPRNADRKASAAARQQLAAKTRPLRNELSTAEQRIEKLGKERDSIEAQIVAGALSGPDMAEAGRRLNHIAAEVAMLEERWLELTGEIEAIEAAG